MGPFYIIKTKFTERAATMINTCVSPFLSSPVQTEERNKQRDMESAVAQRTASPSFDRPPIVDFLESDPKKDAFDIPPQFQKKKQVKHRRSKRGHVRQKTTKHWSSSLSESTSLAPTDVRNMGDDLIMRNVVQSHEPLPDPTMIPASSTGNLHSLLDTIPSSEMTDYPEGLKVKELEITEMKELFSSPFVMTASSSRAAWIVRVEKGC